MKTPLTTQIVKNHKKGVISDAPPHAGLRLIANKNGTKTWVYRYRTAAPEKKIKQMKLGDFPDMSLADARTEHQKQRSIRNQMGDPARYRSEQKREKDQERVMLEMSSYTVEDLIDHYIEEHIKPRRRKKGSAECGRMLRADVIPKLGRMPVIEVKRRHIHELIHSIALRAPRIATMVKVELNGAFELAISSGRVTEDYVNPTFGVKTPKHKARTRTFTDKETSTFLQWLHKSGLSSHMQSILRLILLTGCRGGEVVSMRWKDLDFKSKEWYLHTTKNGLPHRVYLSDQVIALIRAIPIKNEVFVFPSNLPNRHIRQHAIVWQVSKYRESSGLDHWTSHDLRRTMGTGLARLGCSRVVQDRILNHVDSSVSGIYDRYSYDDEARLWWQKWADYLDTLQ